MSVVAHDGQVCLADPCIGGPPATKSARIEIGGHIPFAKIVVPTTSNALAHVFFLKGALKVEALLGHDYSPFMFRGGLDQIPKAICFNTSPMDRKSELCLLS